MPFSTRQINISYIYNFTATRNISFDLLHPLFPLCDPMKPVSGDGDFYGREKKVEARFDNPFSSEKGDIKGDREGRNSKEKQADVIGIIREFEFFWKSLALLTWATWNKFTVPSWYSTVNTVVLVLSRWQFRRFSKRTRR